MENAEMKTGNSKRPSMSSYWSNQRFKLVGQRFGLLQVMSVSVRNGIGFATCVCDCGQFAFVRISNLRSRQTRSCGCLRRGKRSNLEESKNHECAS